MFSQDGEGNQNTTGEREKEGELRKNLIVVTLVEIDAETPRRQTAFLLARIASISSLSIGDIFCHSTWPLFRHL